MRDEHHKPNNTGSRSDYIAREIVEQLPNAGFAAMWIRNLIAVHLRASFAAGEAKWRTEVEALTKECAALRAELAKHEGRSCTSDRDRNV